MENKKTEIGIVGLGVMGRNLSLNVADHGFSVAGYDKDSTKVEALLEQKQEGTVHAAEEVRRFIELLRTPRAILILVPAGAAVDSVIDDLLPHLKQGDVLIDGGNSHYTDTERRMDRLQSQGIHFLGMGISGGEAGARYGPSMMPGGDREAYARVQTVLEACAARVEGDPCVTYLGPRSAGHYVKMVHNGIEYALMQLIAESYDLMSRGLGLDDAAIAAAFSDWSEEQLHGYLMGITADIFRKPDDRSEGRLIDNILDAARQNGTGQWTAQSALDLRVPTLTIDTAVAMRNLSADLSSRLAIARKFENARHPIELAEGLFLDHLEHSLYAAMIVAYAQGMDLLQAASQEYHYDLDLADVACIWRGGCIIRSVLLNAIRSAYAADSSLSPMLLDDHLGAEAYGRMNVLRDLVTRALQAGSPVPGFSSALAYLESLRSAWLPANLIQAQRDYFGAHSYQRIDVEGDFHTDWAEPKEQE